MNVVKIKKRKTIKKHLYRLSVGALSMLLSSAIFANDLADALDALTNTTQAGVYNSQVRGFMTAGGFSVSFPQRRVNLISITPPQVNAGCGGISLFTGGLSFISGDQFVAMLKGIAADSLGEAFSIAVRTLCPVCATVLADLQKAAQMASKLAMDQCGAAMGLLESGIESVPGLQQFLQGRASLDKGSSGESSDFLGAMDEFTGKFDKALSSRIDSLRTITDPVQRAEALNTSPLGNDTWKVLAGMSVVQKTFILSLLGTTLKLPDAGVESGTEIASSVKQVPVSPSLSVDDLAKLLLFGVEGNHNQQLSLLECPANQAGELWECLRPQPVLVSQSRWYRESQSAVSGGVNLAANGFYGFTYAILLQAVTNVAENKPLGTSVTVTLPPSVYGRDAKVEAHFTLEQLQGFIGLSRLPLYRAINLAAFYPSISATLISGIADVVAEHYAVAYIDHYLLNDKKTDASTDTPETQNNNDLIAGEQGIDPRLLHNVQRAIRELRIELRGQLVLILTQLQAQRAWTDQVNQVQSTVYQELLQEGLDANLSFNLGLSGG